MTQDEFDGLQVGDTIENMNGERGKIVDVSRSGVRVQWGVNPLSLSFPMPRASTIWFSMSVVKDEEASNAGS